MLLHGEAHNGVPIWSKNPIRTKSKGDGSRGPGGPDGSVTPRYITKESRRNVGMAYLETSLRYLVFSARSSFLTIRDHAPRIGIQDDRQINKFLFQPDVGDIGHPELIHAGQDHLGSQVGIDLQAVVGVGGRHYKPALDDAQEIVFPHDPLHPLTIDVPLAGLQLRGDSPASIGRPLQGDLLDLIAQVHVRQGRLHRVQKTVVAGAAESGYLAHVKHAHPRPCFYFFFDLLVEAAPVLRARSRRCSSTCCKARFKKSISIACWPTLRSSSATLVSSARFFPAPLKARSPCSCNSRRQR